MVQRESGLVKTGETKWMRTRRSGTKLVSRVWPPTCFNKKLSFSVASQANELSPSVSISRFFLHSLLPSLSYIIIFFYKLTFNSTPFHLLTPSSCIGSRLLSSSRYYYFSLFLFLSFPTHSSRFLSLFDRFSDSLFRTLCHPLYIYIYNKYIYIFLAHRHADWTGACESSRYSGGPPTGPPVAGKVSSFCAE